MTIGPLLIALISCQALALAQTTGLTGRIVHSVTHAPLAGITVRVASISHVTGPDGRFSFLDVEPGRHVVEVETEDYLCPPIGYMATLTSGQTLGGVEVPLIPMASIQGRVVANDGAPVSLAVIKLTPVRAFNSRELARSATSDGRFRIEHVPPGEYNLVVRYSGPRRDARRLFRQTSRPITVTPGSTISGLALPVRWETPLRIRGRMVASDPAAKLRVSVASDDDRVSLFDLTGSSAPVQPDGSFELTGVLAGKNRLYLLTSPQASDGAGMGVAGSITVDVPADGLNGVLMHPYAKEVTLNGRAAPGTRVFLQAAGPLPIAEGSEATAGSNGAFQLHVERRKYSVVSRDLRAVSLDGSAVSGGILDLSSGPAERTLNLQTSSVPATVKGLVTIANRAAPQAYVDFWSLVSKVRFTTRADQNGEYQQQLPAGDYHVSASLNWAFSDTPSARTITVEEGEEKTLPLPLTR